MSRSAGSASSRRGPRAAVQVSLEPEEALRAALTVALRLLAARELSAARVREKLAARGFGQETLDEVVARLTRSGAFDDGRAVRACARTLISVHRRGHIRAIRELQAMGFAGALVREAVAEVLGQVDERQSAAHLVRARLKGGRVVTDAAMYRRLFASLIRRGFDNATARAALEPYWKRSGVPVEPGTDDF